MKVENLEIINQEVLNDVLFHSPIIDKNVSSREMTGYPTVDRPWDKYYRQTPVREIDPNQTMYGAITNLNAENMDLDAIGYLGINIAYKDMISRADKLAENLKELGIKKDEVVLLSLPSMPEASMLLLALNKIGAVSKWIDLRVKEDDLRHYINEHESRHVIIFDILSKQMKNIIDDTDVEKAIVVTPVESLGIIPKTLYNLKEASNEEIFKDKRFVKYSDILKKKSEIEVTPISYEKERPSLIIQSSGTTGKAKSIIHTDYGINSSVRKFSYMDLPLFAGGRILVVVPTWIGYGIGNSYYLALALGMKAELCPKVDRDTVFDNLGKFDISFAAPIHYRYIAEIMDELENLKTEDSAKFKNILRYCFKCKDLKEAVNFLRRYTKCRKISDAKVFVSGGDKYAASEIESDISLFRQHGFTGTILNGYGNNEGFGAESINPISHNRYDTVGIPFYGDAICAVNSDNEELKYDEIGEICVRTETEFVEYANRPEETREVKQTHSDGNNWIHTGDLGKIDEEGFIHLEGRLKRVIIRQAFKIFPGTIEEVIKSHPMVKDCVTVGVDDERDCFVPMAFICLKEECQDYEGTIGEINLLCESKLKDYEIPAYFEIVDEIPYTKNNKQDYRKLEIIGNEKVRKEAKQKVLK